MSLPHASHTPGMQPSSSGGMRHHQESSSSEALGLHAPPNSTLSTAGPAATDLQAVSAVLNLGLSHGGAPTDPYDDDDDNASIYTYGACSSFHVMRKRTCTFYACDAYTVVLNSACLTHCADCSAFELM